MILGTVTYSVAWWCNGYGVGLQLERSRVQLPAVLLSGNDLGQVVHTHVPLSPSRIVLVPVVGQRCPATGKVTVGLALHWPCVTDLSGLSTYGLKV